MINSQIHTFNISEDIVLVTVADVAGNLGGVPPIIPAHGSLTVDIDYPNDSSPGNYIAVDSWSMVDYEANTLADRTGTGHHLGRHGGQDREGLPPDYRIL